MKLYGQFQNSNSKRNNDAATKSIDHQPSGQTIIPSKASTSFSRQHKEIEKKSVMERRKNS
jgi:hypothetical protein